MKISIELCLDDFVLLHDFLDHTIEQNKRLINSNGNEKITEYLKLETEILQRVKNQVDYNLY